MRSIVIAIATIFMLMNPSAKMVCQEPTLSDLAARVDMTEEEFIFMSSVVEAESDRSDDIEGRILIALTIINRVEDPRFPDTITAVLTQRGQFATVRNGHSVVDRTDLSDEAVIQAFEWNATGEDPNILFFNCIGYNYGEPYGDGPIDGNYFMTLD